MAAGPLFLGKKKKKIIFLSVPQKSKGSEVSNLQNYFSHSNAKAATGKVKRISTPVSDRLCGFHGLRLKKNLSFPSVSALQNCLHLSVSQLRLVHRETFTPVSTDIIGLYWFASTVLHSSNRQSKYPPPRPPQPSPVRFLTADEPLKRMIPSISYMLPLMRH